MLRWSFDQSDDFAGLLSPLLPSGFLLSDFLSGEAVEEDESLDDEPPEDDSPPLPAFARRLLE